jgi:hypothetical protein
MLSSDTTFILFPFEVLKGLEQRDFRVKASPPPPQAESRKPAQSQLVLSNVVLWDSVFGEWLSLSVPLKATKAVPYLERNQ